MNWDIIEGKWEQFKGNAQIKWGKLTDDELDIIAGNKSKLAGKIQEKYGYSRDKAEAAADEWIESLENKH